MCYLYWLHHTYNHYDFRVEGYIGVTNNPKERLLGHKAKCLNVNKHLFNAFQKYGNDVVMTILWEGSEDECYKMEAQYRPLKDIGWNILVGGNHPPYRVGWRHLQAVKEKISVSRKGKLKGDKHPHWKKIFSDQTRKRMSESFSKEWIVINPHGEKIHIKNLTKFCDQNNLAQSAMIVVSQGKRQHHKGWRCQRFPTFPSENGSG